MKNNQIEIGKELDKLMQLIYLDKELVSDLLKVDDQNRDLRRKRLQRIYQKMKLSKPLAYFIRVLVETGTTNSLFIASHEYFKLLQMEYNRFE